MQEELDEARRRWLECVADIAAAVTARHDVIDDVRRWSTNDALEESDAAHKRDELNRIIAEKCEEMRTIEGANRGKLGCAAVIPDAAKLTDVIRTLVAIIVASDLADGDSFHYGKVREFTAVTGGDDLTAAVEARQAFHCKEGVLYPLVRLQHPSGACARTYGRKLLLSGRVS